MTSLNRHYGIVIGWLLCVQKGVVAAESCLYDHCGFAEPSLTNGQLGKELT